MSLWGKDSMWVQRELAQESREQSQAHAPHNCPNGQCWPALLHLVRGGENTSWRPFLHFPLSKHLNDLNVRGVPAVMLEDWDSGDDEGKHQGFRREAGAGDRMGPWLRLNDEMFWRTTNLQGIEQEQGLEAQRHRAGG